MNKKHDKGSADADDTMDAVGGQNLLGEMRLSELQDAGIRLWLQALKQPALVADEGFKLYAQLAGIMLRGRSEADLTNGDKRFTDPSWRQSGFYTRLLEAHKAWSQSLQNYADRAGFDERETRRAKFLLMQVSEAFAPTNFLFGNPAALKRAIESGGRSLIEGYQNWVSDLTARRPVPSQVDTRPFKVGENLAATAGTVVLRTELFELLQYAPQTEKVYERPMLVIPSIINKYYAFDLAPGRSLIEHLIKNQMTVFTIVWRNPKPEHDSWGMDAYMEAMDQAVRAVQEITGVQDPHLFGVCGACPLVVSLAGYYTAREERNIGSLALFVGPLDMKALGDAPTIGDFMDAKATRMSKGFVKKSDRISADEFTLLFAMLRPNDLIWNYWVNNYLMGEGPPAFDVLAWNADATGMTAQFNRDFNAFIARNPLVTPRAQTFRDTPIADISKFDFDSYVVGARTDHICPWPTVYRSAQMLGDRCQFVLGGSGHIQTIVSPPGSPKAFYFTNPDMSKDAQEWFEGAKKVQDTWWTHYIAWYHERSGALVDAPAKPGDSAHPPLGAAPGAYVYEKAS